MPSGEELEELPVEHGSGRGCLQIRQVAHARSFASRDHNKA
jgi:hypothetical protein